jgi:hypothetical protein
VADSATFSSPEAGDDDTGKDLSGLDDMKASQRPDEAPKPKQGRNPKGDGQGKEHKISNVATPINALKLLKDAIEKEARLEPKLRCHKYRRETLDYFLTCKKTTEDHDLWRECFMHEEMLAILNRRFNALNPHKKGEAEYETALAEGLISISDKQFQILYRYTQEVDESGRTQEETDKTAITKLPNLTQLELELQAAENYIAIKWEIARKRPPEKEAEESKGKKQSTNPNPVLDWSELLKELETPNVSANTISRAIGRSISNGQKKGSPPWAIGGCASEYQIVDDPIKENQQRPTSASCKYQKIAID